MAFGASPFVDGAFGGAALVKAAGAFDAAGAEALKAALLAGVESAEAAVIVDMRAAESIGAAGLWVLMIAHRTARAAGKTLAVAAPTALVREILAISRIDRVFPVYDTVREALAATTPEGLMAFDLSPAQARA
jgi:anti-anti-sigma factor